MDVLPGSQTCSADLQSCQPGGACGALGVFLSLYLLGLPWVTSKEVFGMPGCIVRNGK